MQINLGKPAAAIYRSLGFTNCRPIAAQVRGTGSQGGGLEWELTLRFGAKHAWGLLQVPSTMGWTLSFGAKLIVNAGCLVD